MNSRIVYMPLSSQCCPISRFGFHRVLNSIFCVLRSGAPPYDLPDAFGPYTTCYSRFVRWWRVGVWRRITDALAGAHDAAVQMIDISERLFKRVEQCRRVTRRYDKLGANYLAFVRLASIRLWLRANEFAS